ncbi:glutamate--tRNA ligase [endosymbiont of Euscepes postfasciatus]|uniref:glutamate--tRNA ligase n=1 Tax=endosymbiont of Euscepes postfasciatus TaxID=650377 RepID=UPI000DC716EF|nr:glutamate--tRNA ligase [endosymbiont of Euscepes postfasciatus]BBA84626.1 glutamate--tRNA ligase [endosymbiont of Euscepes postfasciatus]
MIITRFAPSPNGYLHIGNIRIALYSWIFAKKNNGKFLLRIEDTDINDSNKIFKKNIIKDMKWLGLNWDNKVIIQSDRINIYNKIIDELLESKLAYPCFCKINNKIFKKNKKYKKYNKFCRYKNFSSYDLKNKLHVIRFKNPINTEIILNDKIYGLIKFNSNELDDLIIRRENKLPTYNFCVVVDDIYSKITHIIRGSDHISNTPKQINIFNAMNYKVPEYIHIPIILDKNKNKISKIKNNLNLKYFKYNGILSKSIIHYLSSIGNSCFENINKNVFSKKEIINNFNIYKINKSQITFDYKKVLQINKNYLCYTDINKIYKFFRKFINLKKIKIKNDFRILKLFRNSYFTFNEIIENNDFLYIEPKLNINLLKNNLTINNFNIINTINNIKNNIFFINKWNLDNINISLCKEINKYSIEYKHYIYKIIRILISGKLKTTSISIIIYILGKNISINRLDKINIIK